MGPPIIRLNWGLDSIRNGMNKTLRLSLLGSPLVQLGDELVAGLSPQKVKALLIYLAYTAQPQPRELLADLFFDDRPPKQAATA